MRIVHVIASLGMGGAEVLLAGLTRLQAERGEEVHIVTLLSRRVVEIHPAVSVHDLSDGGRPRNPLKLLSRLARKLDELAPDVVHSHMLHSNLLTRLARAGRHRYRLINTVHSAYETSSRLYRLGYRLLDPLSDATVFVSREAMDRYLEEHLSSAARSRIVYNGIDVSRFERTPGARDRSRSELGVSDATRLLIAVGRLEPEKDYPALLKAFARLRVTQPDTALVVAGTGYLQGELEGMARTLGIHTSVRFLGLRRDIPELLSASDVFVLSSAWEGFGLVIAEAMACGIPVVSTDCGGTAEVVGDCGELVPPRDPIALASAIQRVLDLPPEEREALGRRARDRIVTRFSLQASLRAWDAMYRGESARCASPEIDPRADRP